MLTARIMKRAAQVSRGISLPTGGQIPKQFNVKLARKGRKKSAMKAKPKKALKKKPPKKR